MATLTALTLNCWSVRLCQVRAVYRDDVHQPFYRGLRLLSSYRKERLIAIANEIRLYDVVALQEVSSVKEEGIYFTTI